MVIILGCVAWLGWIPPVTYVRRRENFWLHAVQFLLPALAVGYRSSALIMRITRSALLEVLREDYIRTAWAKGQSDAGRWSGGTRSRTRCCPSSPSSASSSRS